MNSNKSFDNPYRPPDATDNVTAAGVPMDFSGEITRADYQQMLPTTMDIVWGKVLLALGLIIFLPLLVGVGVIVVRQLPNPDLAAAIGASLLVSLAVAGAIYLVSSRARAYRYLHRNADLLGRAQGTLSERGLVFDDGNFKHWLSWPSLHAVLARNDGVRVSLDPRPHRFLALSSRNFLSYSRKHADGLVTAFGKRWRTSDELQVISGEVFDKSLNDEGFFCGTVSASQSFKSAELWTSVVSELTTGVVLILLAVFAFGYWRLSAIVGIYCLIVSAQRYRL